MLREEIGVLIVDDVNAMRVQVRELLKTLGFRKLVLASNGQEAVQRLGEETIHLILSDWHMAPMGGMELLKYVRSNPTYANVAFVMLTGESTKESVVEAIKAGVDDYLLKPATAAQFQGKVYGVLLRRQIL
jgi:two-component system chemotaxis response regulator CheY